MVCLQCSSETQIINSRPQKRINAVWRRRRCTVCTSTFTTHETADLGAAWRVKTQNGVLTPFSRDKLFLSLYASLQHRPDAIEDASALTETVMTKLANAIHDGLVKSSDITQYVLAVLNRFDSVASVHFQAFHKRATGSSKEH